MQFINSNYKAWHKPLKGRVNSALKNVFKREDGTCDKEAVRTTFFMSLEDGAKHSGLAA